MGRRGCLDWQQEGLKAAEPFATRQKGYRAEMDVLAAFLEERCVFDKGAEPVPPSFTGPTSGGVTTPASTPSLKRASAPGWGSGG